MLKQLLPLPGSSTRNLSLSTTNPYPRIEFSVTFSSFFHEATVFYFSSLLSLRPFFYLISVPENSKIQKSQFRNPNSLDSSLEQCKFDKRDDTFSTIEISSRLIEYRDYIAYSFRKFRRFEEELSKLDTTAISLYYTLLNCVRS